MTETIRTFGYSKDGKAEIFHLRPGESLPQGWFDAPVTAEPKPAEPVPARRPRKG